MRVFLYLILLLKDCMTGLPASVPVHDMYVACEGRQGVRRPTAEATESCE